MAESSDPFADKGITPQILTEALLEFLQSQKMEEDQKITIGIDWGMEGQEPVLAVYWYDDPRFVQRACVRRDQGDLIDPTTLCTYIPRVNQIITNMLADD